MTVDLRALPTTEARSMEFLRHMAAIGVAAFASGVLVGGLGSRLFMLVARLLAPERIGVITENGNRVGEVTFGGTVALLIFVGLPTAMAIGVLAASAEPWIGWTGRLEGLALGALLLAVFSPVVVDPDNIDFFILGNQAANLAMIVVLFVLGGVGAVWLRDRFLQVLPREERFGSASAIYALISSFGVLALSLALAVLGFDGGAGLLLALLMVVLAASAVADWVTRIKGVPRRRIVAVLGYGALLTLLIFTVPRLVADVRQILP